MPTRNIKLTDHLDRFVEGQVGSGRFKNASEVMRAGLRLLESQKREEDEKLSALRKLAAEGFDALDRGEADTIEGTEQLGAFIARIGKRAARRVERRSGAK
jgi:antitoxin ParD1/3/4